MDEIPQAVNRDGAAFHSGGDEQATTYFPRKISPAFQKLIDQTDPYDPIGLQVIPQAAESIAQPGFSEDPLNEEETQEIPGLLMKYPGRALIKVTSRCPIHCRFCFRRHAPKVEPLEEGKQLKAIFKRLKQEEQLKEIILSGGEPFMVGNRPLKKLLEQIKQLKRVKRIRFHTRAPVTLHHRFDHKLFKLLKESTQQIIVVLHSNHARELSRECRNVLRALRDAHVVLLSQSVLLKGINDDVDTLKTLMQSLMDHHVIPYYLHVLDPVDGAAHFAVSDKKARQLHERLRASLPGYAVPRLVREIPRRPCKTVLAG